MFRGRRWGLGAIALVMLVAMAALLAGCAGCPGQPSESIQIKGSDTMLNLGSAWAEVFMKKYPKVNIAITGGGSGTGIAALLNKTCDIAQASRKMSQKEYDQARANGFEAVEMVVALDGLSVVVNPANPVNELTTAQLSAIYTNKVTNWKEVGGNDAPMVVLSRDTSSGSHLFFKEHVVQMLGLPTADKSLEYGPKVLMLSSSKVAVDEVATNPLAIFYVGLGHVTPKVKVIGIKKDAPSSAIKASIETVKNDTYPIARPLQFYTRGQPTGLLKTYVDWVLSPEGQDIAQKLDFVPVK